MNPKWYPGYFLDPQHWPEWMPDVMDQSPPSSLVRTPPAPSLETWLAPSSKPSYALFSDLLEGPRPKSLEEQRAELIAFAQSMNRGKKESVGAGSVLLQGRGRVGAGGHAMTG